MTVWSWLWIAVLPAVIAVAAYGTRAYGRSKRKWSIYSGASELCLILGGCAVAATIITSIVLVAYAQGGAYAGRQCVRYGEATEVTTTFTRWSFWTWDCYVDTDKGKITLDQYKGFEEIDRT